LKQLYKSTKIVYVCREGCFSFQEGKSSLNVYATFWCRKPLKEELQNSYFFRRKRCSCCRIIKDVFSVYLATSTSLLFIWISTIKMIFVWNFLARLMKWSLLSLVSTPIGFYLFIFEIEYFIAIWTLGL